MLKPKDGSFGRGVFVNITSVEELEACYDYTKELGTTDEIIIEQYIAGNDYRLYIVGDEVVGAMHRRPPNVIGDGVHNIEQLVELKKMQKEKKNPRLVSCPIVVNDELTDYIARDGHSLSSIPEKDELIYLNFKGNISLGGDPIDVLDTLSEEVKSTAVKALRSIAGLTHGAVDLIINETDDKPFVLELNLLHSWADYCIQSKASQEIFQKQLLIFISQKQREIMSHKLIRSLTFMMSWTRFKIGTQR